MIAAGCLLKTAIGGVRAGGEKPFSTHTVCLCWCRALLGCEGIFPLLFALNGGGDYKTCNSLLMDMYKGVESVTGPGPRLSMLHLTVHCDLIFL